MQFLFPAFLIALASLAIPIIIHLFYFRRYKKVYFTNVRFLREVKEETSARSKLRNWLVLLMRCLAIAFLVFAFAQPFIPSGTDVSQGSKDVSIFIDNSFSMGALSQDVPLLEEGKRRARDIVEAYAVDDRFQILTNDLEGRHQRLVGKEEALAYIDEIALTPSVKPLNQILVRQEQALNQGTNDIHVAYWISDFQKNITRWEEPKDTALQLNLIPLQAVQERNISIDSVWMEAPVPMLNQPNNLIVKVKNWTDEEAENVRLTLKHEGQVMPVGTLTIPPQTAVLDTISMQLQHVGWHEAELQITDYPIQFDDLYHIALQVAEEVQVAIINEVVENTYLTSAFNSIPYFRAENLTSRSLDYSRLPGYQFIVLNELPELSSGLSFALKEYVENGGNLLVFPAALASLESYNSFLSAFPANVFTAFESRERVIGQVNVEEFIFRDVFENKSANLRLPTTQGNFAWARSGTAAEETLMSYRDGSSFLAKYQAGQGHLYVMAAPLSEAYNNMTRNAEIFIPMLYKMAISSGRGQKIAYTIGDDEVISADVPVLGSEIVYQLEGPGIQFIPSQRITGSRLVLTVSNEIPTAGIYKLERQQEGESLAEFAFNYNRKESNLAYFSIAELKELVGDRASIIEASARANFEVLIGERNQGVVLWRWCLFLVLIFLGIEQLLLRFWKV
ncbi:MAG: BatA domain-containing protein [Saprospirales bacterium]|nr:BatA domain-containing protein [Saprospirales bacterium]